MTTDTAALLNIRALSACISVDDLDACAGWYAEHLGFEVAQSHALPEIGARVAYLEGHGLRLELAEQYGARRAPERPDPPEHAIVHGISQITFYVADLDTVQDYARRAGLTVAMEKAALPELGVTAFFVRDPEGNLIEFIELTKPPQERRSTMSTGGTT
ncbi:VOC family protein [Actinomadura fibrosa]|uniref:VOC family protein n=1 Tax=Actinomadura fibrosa TaxID=111802 RepID=A0ABW2XDG5_9ACTN|nr:VOC family protein [Actinomadura fibrosa]